MYKRQRVARERPLALSLSLSLSLSVVLALALALVLVICRRVVLDCCRSGLGCHILPPPVTKMCLRVGVVLIAF